MFLIKATTETASAAIDSARENHPRSSLAAFWRRLTSISQRNQSPEFPRSCDQCVASSSEDILRNCCNLNLAGYDIDKYLARVEKRYRKTGWCMVQAPDPRSLTCHGHLIAIDIPKLIALVRELRSGAELL